MKIAVISQSGPIDFLAPRSGPWSFFFEQLEMSGHKVVRLKDKPEAYISMNHHPSTRRLYDLEIPKKNRVLILWEPKVTRPVNFDRQAQSKYGKVFSPSHMWPSSREMTEYFNWPQGEPTATLPPDEQWNQRLDVLLAVQSNKYSFVKGELYSLRRKFYLESKVDFHLYGGGWNEIGLLLKNISKAGFGYLAHKSGLEHSHSQYILGGFRKSKGKVENKFNLMRRYKYSLVLENSRDYVSEKLFESIACGTLPIYVGPRLSEFGIPDTVALQVEPSVEGIKSGYQQLRDDFTLSQSILREIRKFLASEEFLQHRNDIVLANLARRISLYLEENCVKK